jgi:hypothetical protein
VIQNEYLSSFFTIKVRQLLGISVYLKLWRSFAPTRFFPITLAKTGGPQKELATMARAKKTDDNGTPKKASSRAKSGNGTGAATAEARTPQPETVGNLTTMTMSDEQVRARAYELYLQRQGDGGTPEEDWYRAEAELRGKSA